MRRNETRRSKEKREKREMSFNNRRAVYLSTRLSISINNTRHHNRSTRTCPPWAPPSTVKSDDSFTSLLRLLLGSLLGLLRLSLGLLASLLRLALGLLTGLLGLALDFLTALACFGVLVFTVLASLVVAVLGVLLGVFGFLAGVVKVLLRCVAGGFVARTCVVCDQGEKVGDDAEGEGDQGGDVDEDGELVLAGFAGLGELVCERMLAGGEDYFEWERIFIPVQASLA